MKSDTLVKTDNGDNTTTNNKNSNADNTEAGQSPGQSTAGDSSQESPDEKAPEKAPKEEVEDSLGERLYYKNLPHFWDEYSSDGHNANATMKLSIGEELWEIHVKRSKVEGGDFDEDDEEDNKIEATISCDADDEEYYGCKDDQYAQVEEVQEENEELPAGFDSQWQPASCEPPMVITTLADYVGFCVAGKEEDGEDGKEGDTEDYRPWWAQEGWYGYDSETHTGITDPDDPRLDVPICYRPGDRVYPLDAPIPKRHTDSNDPDGESI